MAPFLAFLLILLSPLPWAQQPAPDFPPVQRHVLKNGLTVLLLERHHAPLIAFRVYFKVGAVEDQPGRSGLAHLFEHMIFKGTRLLNSKNYAKEKIYLDQIETVAQQMIEEENKGRAADARQIQSLRKQLQELQEKHSRWMVEDEYERLYQEHGGTGFNAHTAPDYTSYEISLPSHKLPLWMILESDRFQNPVLREFYKERDVVMEERRMGYESSPGGKLWEVFISQAFLAHPYGQPGIGWMSDLKRLTRTDAEEFFRKYYGPNNATVALVGDIQPQKTLELFRKYFEGIPARPLPGRTPTEEPPQEGERRAMVYFQAEPLLEMGYHVPSIHHPDHPALEATAELLSSGRTSRFYRNLIEGKKMASQVSAYTQWPGVLYPGLFLIDAAPRRPHAPEKLEEAIEEELENIQKDPPAVWEMEKLANQLEADLTRRMKSNEGMAELLAHYQTIAGDWRYPWFFKEKLRAMKPQEIQRVAQKYLRPENKTTAILKRPPEKQEGDRP
ncbi:MAG: insulinase family protein [Elusimicrobia bacterium]|nr:insulinase family protein [Elusimicrobiota bacterium]